MKLKPGLEALYVIWPWSRAINGFALWLTVMLCWVTAHCHQLNLLHIQQDTNSVVGTD